MVRATRCLSLTLLAGVVACADGVSRLPLAPTEGLVPTFAAGASGCYTPRFHVAAVPTGPLRFEGPVTGDLEGSVTVEFDPASITPLRGVTAANYGTARWTITGGIIPGLATFDTRFDNRNIVQDRPGSPATLFENTGRHRALSGVDEANLTYRGTFTLVPSPLAEHRYQGVICP